MGGRNPAETKIRWWGSRLRADILSFVPSLLIALGIGSVVILLIGKSPIEALGALFGGALGSGSGIAGTLNLTSVFLVTGLATVVAFSAGIFSVGMEGQLYLGGIASLATAVYLAPTGILGLPVAVAAGMLAGALFALIPGLLKAMYNVNEIVTTLLMNYVALFIVDYVAAGPFHQAGAGLNITVPVQESGKMPLLAGSTVNAGILVALIMAAIVFVLLRRTKFGFEIRMMGGNIRAARYAKVNILRNTVKAMLVSGALAGLAGSFLLLGSTYAWFVGVSKYYGYLGIGVALLAALGPLAVIPSALFFAILNVGGGVMQSSSGVPYAVAQMIAAIIVIVTLMRTVFMRSK